MVRPGNEKVNLSLSVEIMDELRKRCWRSGDMSDIVEKALRKYFKTERLRMKEILKDTL